jgi:3-oxoacyl-[acyl-carrier protein] reductase
MDLGVRDRLYIILGGSRGMGFAAARALAADGARLALISRSPADITTAAAAIAAEFGTEAMGYPADAASAGAFEAAVTRIITAQGSPRGLLITSGLTGRNGSLLETSDDDWSANFQDVVMGHVRACRAVVPHLIAAGGGTIVTTAAYSARAAKTFLFPYAAMKAAVINFTKNLAKTHGSDGIRANCVCPGAFETVRVNARIDEIMAQQNLPRDQAAAFLVENVFKMPVALRRPGRAHEAGELMAFLLSERAAYLTGAVINIDGGTDF